MNQYQIKDYNQNDLILQCKEFFLLHYETLWYFMKQSDDTTWIPLNLR